MKTILFYSSVKDKKLFHTQKFYDTDILILKELGYQVILSNKIYDAFLFWRYNIVFAYFYKWSFFVALIASFFFKKVYFTGGIDDLDCNYSTSRRYYIQFLFFKLCYFFSTSCIIVSEADRINIAHIYGHKKMNKISFSEHSINISLYDQTSFEIKKKPFFSTIAWMENLGNVDRKGIDLALCVFRCLREKPEFQSYHLCIIGKEGEGSDYLKLLAMDLGLFEFIHFTGVISEEKKIQILHESQYYFQLSKYEGFGLAAIEAAACRNIVIHSAMGGLKYTMNDGGVIFDIHKPFQSEVEKLYTKLLSFDSSKTEILYKEICMRFSNERRKLDIERIFINTQ